MSCLHRSLMINIDHDLTNLLITVESRIMPKINAQERKHVMHCVYVISTQYLSAPLITAIARSLEAGRSMILASHLPQPSSSSTSMSSPSAGLPLPSCHVPDAAIFDLACADPRSMLTVAFLRACSRCVLSAADFGGVSSSIVAVRSPAAGIFD